MRNILFFLAIILAGCETIPPVYNPDGLVDTELVEVTTATRKESPDGYKSGIVYVYNEIGERVVRHKKLLDVTVEKVFLRPGVYTFDIQCLGGNGVAVPKVTHELLKGKLYKIYCAIGKGKNLFGISVDSFAQAVVREVEQHNTYMTEPVKE